MKVTVVSVELGDDDGSDDCTITTMHKPGIIGKLFGMREKRVQYVGSGTVWHRLPKFMSCDGRIEVWLYDRWMQARHERRTITKQNDKEMQC